MARRPINTSRYAQLARLKTVSVLTCLTVGPWRCSASIALTGVHLRGRPVLVRAPPSTPTISRECGPHLRSRTAHCSGVPARAAPVVPQAGTREHIPRRRRYACWCSTRLFTCCKRWSNAGALVVLSPQDMRASAISSCVYLGSTCPRIQLHRNTSLLRQYKSTWRVATATSGALACCCTSSLLAFRPSAPRLTIPRSWRKPSWVIEMIPFASRPSCLLRLKI